MNPLLDELRDAIGPAFVLDGSQDRARYDEGARYDSGRSLAVLRPADAQEVSVCLRIAARAGVRIIPQGANTGLVAGSTPDAGARDLVLSLERLKGFAFDADNASARVGADLLLSELNARLEPESLFFPIDLGADPSIGGMIATNTGDARFLRMGGGLRKNKTGPDCKHVLIGTSGTFGVVTEAELRLTPLPRETAVALLVPSSADAVLPILRAGERRFGSVLSAFEGMSGNAMAAALAHVPSLRDSFAPDALTPYAILIEIARTHELVGGGAALDDVLQAGLAEMMEAEPEHLVDARFGPPEKGWALRHALSEGVKAAGRLIAFDLGFRRGDTMLFRSRMEAELAHRHPKIRLCDFGHVGDGGLHFNLVVPRDGVHATDPAAETALRDRIVAVAVEEFGGSFSAEHAVGRRNQPYVDAYGDPILKAWSAALLDACGPARLGAARFD